MHQHSELPPSEVKEDFFSDLQATIGGIDEHDVLLVVGDFNARVGSSDRGRVDAAWDGARGFHEVGKLNEPEVELMSFCSVKELVIMNTSEKKSIHKPTWQHPGSKEWDCIDYVVMRKDQKRLCLGVNVVHSAVLD